MPRRALAIACALLAPLLPATPAHASTSTLNTVVATIPLTGTPSTLAMSPTGSRLYVANTGGTSVFVIDTATNTVVSTITVGAQPTPMAVTPDGSTLFVANWADDTISVVDTATNTVSATITPSGSPDLRALAVTADGSKLAATDLNNGRLLVYSVATRAQLAAVATGSGAQRLLLSPDGSTAYVSNLLGNSVSAVNLSTFTATTVALHDGPRAIELSPDGSRLFVGLPSAPQIVVIGTAGFTTETSITTGQRADYLGTTSTTLLAANYSPGLIVPVTIGTWTVGSTITVALKPRQILTTADGQTAYSLGETTATVTAFSPITGSVLASIPVGASPSMAAFTPDGSRLYVTNASGSVSVIDTDTPTSRDTSQDPQAALQQFAVPAGTLPSACPMSAPEAVEWPGLRGMRDLGWSIAYAAWPNSGSGGWVCSRQPVWRGTSWGFAR